MDAVLRKYFWLINVATVACAAFFCGRAVARGIEASVFLGADELLSAAPQKPRGQSPGAKAQARAQRAKDGEPILRRNFFCADCPPIIEEPDTAGSTSNDPVKSSLPLQLVATLVADDPVWSFAAVRDTNEKKTGLFHVGSIIPPSVEVVAIEARRVFIANGGRPEYLDLEGAGVAPPPPSASSAPTGVTGAGPLGADIDRGVRKVSESEYDIDRGLIDKVLGDPTFLARSARIVPSVKDGKANGFKIYAIRPGSVYGKIGLSNGDTIHAINGHEITSPDKALEVYTKVRNASHITVSLTRKGEPRTLDYSIR